MLEVFLACLGVRPKTQRAVFSRTLAEPKYHDCDPAQSEVEAAAQKENVRIESILTTHHHWYVSFIYHHDVKGTMRVETRVCHTKPRITHNLEYLETHSGTPVYGGDERVEALSHLVKQNDNIQVGSLSVKVHHTPCHTTGHVLYQVKMSYCVT